MVVLKFGGTSVADIPQIKKIALKETGGSEGTYISQDMNIFKYLKNGKNIENTFLVRIKDSVIKLGYDDEESWKFRYYKYHFNLFHAYL